MIEREYVKLNTSIQTGSNASTLKYDDEGNIEASIELRLPDSLFTNDPAHRIDGVQMQTSKMRLSMENTPIAAFPLDEELTTENTQVTKCQVDVYPYSFLDDNKIAPTPGDSANPIAFPSYKKHFITYKFKVVYYSTNAATPVILDFETFYGESNNPDLWFPKNSRFYQMLVKTNVLTASQHMMNITTASNHEDYRIDGDIVYVRNIGGLTQMLQDALENAVTYASTEDNIVLNIYLLNVSYWTPPDLKPTPQYDNYVVLDEFFGDKYCFWKMEYDAANSTHKCDLAAAFKPQIRFDEQSMSVSYDSASFKDMIPIFWNPCFVNTYGQPEQMTIDTLRNEVWNQPLPKRIYRYGVTVNDDPRTYSYTLPENMKCALMNFVGNEQMRKIFSFLPWIKMDLDKAVIEGESSPLFSVEDKFRIAQFTSTTTRYYNPANDTISFPTEYLTPAVDSDGNYVFRYKKDENGGMYDCEWLFTNVDGFGSGDSGIDINLTPSRSIVKDEVLDTYTSNNPDLVEGVFNENILPLNADRYIRLIKPGVNVTIDEPLGTCIYRSSSNAVQYCEMVKIDSTVTINSNVAAYLQTHSPRFLDFVRHYIPISEGTTSETFDGEYYIRTYKRQPSYPLFRKTTTNYSNLSLVEYRNLNNSYPSYYIQHRVTITKLSDVASDKSLIVPNLTPENNSFYILDGTTSEVTIGQQEVIERETPGLYEVSLGVKTENLKTKATGRVKNPRPNDTTSGITSLPEARPWYLYDSNHVTDIPDGLTYTFQSPSGNKNPGTRTNELWEIYSAMRRPNEVPGEELAPTTVTVQSTDPFEVDSVEDDLDPGSTTTEPPFLPPGTQYEETVVGDVSVDHMTCSHPSYGGRKGIWKLFYLVDGEPRVVTYESTISKSVTLRTTQTGDPDSGNSRSLYVPLANANAVYYYSYDITGPVGGMYIHKVNWRFGGDVSPDQDVDPDYYIYIYDNSYIEIRDIYYDMEQDLSRTDTTSYTVVDQAKEIVGNQRLTFTWNNLPIVVLSPISSIVLTLDGMQVTQEYQPVNIAQPGASSLTSSIPVIENFYSLASTLRDLHDELVVSKDSFDDTATYTMSNTAGYQRSIRISAKYITKDGTLHQIYIPPNGVFCIQLTFGLGIYTLD